MNHENYNGLPRSRAEAKRLGVTRYFTGKTCKNGHIEQRAAHTGRCLECDRERKRLELKNNREVVHARKRAYRENNIDTVRAYERERSRKRYEDDPATRRAYNKLWRGKHAEQERKRGREKYHRTMRDNPEQIRNAWRRGGKKRLSTAKGRLENSICVGVHRGLTKGSKYGRGTFKLLGYSLNELMRHLAKRFQPGMSFDNYGEWHVDHKIPLSAHNYETPDDIDFKRAWALKNLQPMWGPENISKGAKLAAPFQPSLTL